MIAMRGLRRQRRRPGGFAPRPEQRWPGARSLPGVHRSDARRDSSRRVIEASASPGRCWSRGTASRRRASPLRP